MNILVLSPHTDDTELGCGGSLTKWMEKHHIYVVAFSPCVESIPEGWDVNSTKMEFTNSMQTLGCDYELLDFPVRRFPEYRQAILEEMVKLNKAVEPDLVIGSSINDLHQDHKVMAEEMLRAFRCSILGYESPYNNRGFDPNYYERLTEEHLYRKKDLINLYESQKVKNQSYFSKEFVFGLARVRGSQVKSLYAEAFECYRFVS